MRSVAAGRKRRDGRERCDSVTGSVSEVKKKKKETLVAS